jgi:hypothetical protein
MYRILLIVILSFCCAISGAAAQPRLTIQVDERRIAPGGLVHIQYTIEQAKKVSRFEAPDFEGFTVLRGPDYSNGFTLINGEMREYVAVGFVLSPKSSGKIMIAPAKALADGKSLRSEAVTIEVADRSGAPMRQASPSPGDQPLDEMVLRTGEQVQDKIRKNLFVRLELSKRTVYVGEPIVATYKLYTRLNSESRVVKRPSFSGFSVLDMEEPESDLPRTERLNGRDYNVYLLRLVQLFPLQPGTFELESMQVDNTVRFIRESATRNQQSFNDLLRAFGEEGLPPGAWVRETVSLSSAPATVTVKPLPVEGQPADFSGAVGQFRLRSVFSADSFVQGQAYRMDITLEGSGNHTMTSAPGVSWSSAWEHFEPDVRDSLRRDRSPVSGSKTYSIPFSPRQSGRHFLPAAHFAYFDPDTGKYVQLHTDSLLAVVRAASAPMASETDNAREPVDAISVQPETKKFWMIPAFVALGLALAGMAWWISRKARQQSALPAQRLESFPEEAPAPVTQLSLFPAKHSLAAARSFMVMQDAPNFYRELLRIMRAVLAERYGIEALQSGASVAEALQSRFPGSTLPADLHRLLDRCQMAIYAPLADPDEMEGDFRMAEQMLDTLQAAPGGPAPLH